MKFGLFYEHQLPKPRTADSEHHFLEEYLHSSCDSLEGFAREVMPEFQAREAAQQAWKAAVLRRDMVLEEIDTTPFQKRPIAEPGQKTQTLLG